MKHGVKTCFITFAVAYLAERRRYCIAWRLLHCHAVTLCVCPPH